MQARLEAQKVITGGMNQAMLGLEMFVQQTIEAVRARSHLNW